jgi:arabinofuranosyltransferase
VLSFAHKITYLGEPKPGAIAMRRATLLLVYLIACFFVWRSYDYTTIGVDDANIYFTYAKNFAEGHGFVYNPGGEHVEGFTSLLWTLVMSAFYLVFHQHFEIPLLIMNFLVGAGIILVCYRIMERLQFRFRFELLWVMLLCLTPGFLDWCVLSLLETGFWSLLLCICVLQLVRVLQGERVSPFAFGALMGMLIVTRPESLLWSVVLVVAYALANLRVSGSWRKALLRLGISVTFVILFTVGLLAFRKWYFGFPLPNTYYAKVSAEPVKNLIAGLRYLVKFCIQYVMLVLPYLAAIALTLKYTWRKIREGERLSNNDEIQILLLLVGAVNLFIPIFSGGDHFGLARFYQPLVPVMLLPLMHMRFWDQYLPRFDPERNFRPFLVGVFVCVLYWMPLNWILGKNDNQFYQVRRGHSVLHYDFLLASENRTVATRLNEFFKTPPVVGVIATGGFGYAYKGKTIDLMGLNNVAMAHADKIKVGGIKNHNSFNKQVFFAQHPDMIAGFAFLTDTLRLFPFMLDKTFRNGFENSVMKGLYTDPDFLRTYDFVLVSDRHDHYLVTWMRREYAEWLKKDEDYEVKPQGVTIE